jgi:hypothetical protein
MCPAPRQGGIVFFLSRSLLRAAALPHATAARAGSSPSKETAANHRKRQALRGQRASKEGERARCYIHSSPGCWRSHTLGCTMKRSNGGSSAGGYPSKKRYHKNLDFPRLLAVEAMPIPQAHALPLTRALQPAFCEGMHERPTCLLASLHEQCVP